MSTINIGNKMRANVLMIRLQSLSDHQWSKIRTTYSNINYVSNCFSSITFPLTANQLLRKILHLLQYFVDFRHYILSIYKNGRAGSIAKCSMKNSSVLSLIDRNPVKHSFDRLR